MSSSDMDKRSDRLLRSCFTVITSVNVRGALDVQQWADTQDELPIEVIQFCAALRTGVGQKLYGDLQEQFAEIKASEGEAEA